MSDCLFCKILEGKIPAKKIYEDDTVVAFFDIAPKAPTHILVIPRKHIEQLAAMTSEDEGLIGQVLHTAARLAREMGLSDYRVVTNNGEGAGQSVFHIHFHLLGGRRLNWPPG